MDPDFPPPGGDQVGLGKYNSSLTISPAPFFSGSSMAVDFDSIPALHSWHFADELAATSGRMIDEFSAANGRDDSESPRLEDRFFEMLSS